MTSPSTDKPARNRVSKREILRGYQAFGHVLSRGTYVQSRGIRCSYDIQREIPPYTCTVGFAVRKARNAVQRNLIRRLLRESYRQRKHGLLGICTDLHLQLRLVFLVDPRKMTDGITFRTVDESVSSLITNLLGRLVQK